MLYALFSKWNYHHDLNFDSTVQNLNYFILLWGLTKHSTASLIGKKWHCAMTLCIKTLFNSSFQHWLFSRIRENHLLPQFSGGMKYILHQPLASEGFKNKHPTNFQAFKYHSVESQTNSRQLIQKKIGCTETKFLKWGKGGGKTDFLLDLPLTVWDSSSAIFSGDSEPK